VIGHSVRGRPIAAVRLGDPRAAHPLLVVGAIHGDEPAGIAIARLLIKRASAGAPALVVVPDLNPDGAAADTRQNADGVDLNRNFPYGWRHLYQRGDQQYQGPRPLSEPESQAVRRLIIELRPVVTIWFHQPLGLVDRSSGDAAVEDWFAALVGLPVRQLVRYPGSVPTWQNHRFTGTTAFVVELPPGQLTARASARYARAVLRLAASSAADCSSPCRLSRCRSSRRTGRCRP
jgi:protein MpaA